MLLGAAAMVTTAVPATAQNAQAVAFGAREDIQQISLSPNGKQVAMIMPAGRRGLVVTVASVDGSAKPLVVLRSSGDPERLSDCHWSTDTRLICRAVTLTNTNQLIGFSRLLVIDSDGGNMKSLSARTKATALAIMQDGGEVIDWSAANGIGTILVTRSFVPELSIGTHLAKSDTGLGVERVDTDSLERRTVEKARVDAVDYLSDGAGNVRVMTIRSTTSSGYEGNALHHFYRKANSRDWTNLSKVSVASGTEGFVPLAVDPTLDVAYGFDDKDGRAALYSLSLNGTMTEKLVLARPDVDVDGLVRIGRQRRVVGATYVTEKRATEFFDSELRQLRDSLGKALSNKPLITFIDASASEKQLLMFAGSDTDPGTYYVFDKSTRQLAEVLPARSALRKTTLASVKPISFPAADGTMIPGYLTLPPGSDGKNIPAIVMPHGGPSARDEWGFDWLAQYYAARGFAVLQPNYRGSAGYGSEWFQKNGFQSWRTAIGDVNDAGRWLVKQGIADPGHLAIVGWSYGGYAALQSAVVDPDLYKAIVAIAPVTDFEALREESRNYTNFRNVDAYIGRGPHVAAGSPARNAGRIKAPVLLFHGTLDSNVGVGESRLMKNRIENAGGKVRYVEFEGLTHQLDDNVARTRMLDESDSFLRASMGMAAAGK